MRAKDFVYFLRHFVKGGLILNKIQDVGTGSRCFIACTESVEN